MLAKVMGNFLRRVIRIRVDGPINHKLTDKITQGLKKADSYNAEAVMVLINSPAGSLTQTKYILDSIKHYAARKNAPIYCFAEDQCLGSANALLTSGVKCYANSMSLLGDFSFSWSSMWLKKFADKYNIRQEYVHGGKNKVKFNVYEDIKPESEKWMQNHLYLLEHELKVSIINHRNDHFLKNNFEKNDIEEKVFGSLVIEPQKAVETGLIDGIKNCDDLLKEKFSSSKIFDVVKRKGGDRFGRVVSELELRTGFLP